MTQILLCDDEPHIVEGLRHLLRGPDRQIRTAGNGFEALELISQAVPDLLIIDIMMPGISGLEVLTMLREQEQTKNLPIIILTAKGQASQSSMAQEVWGAQVVAKPFEPHSIRELVTTILESEPCPTEVST